jgi:hypothetical protein
MIAIVTKASIVEPTKLGNSVIIGRGADCLLGARIHLGACKLVLFSVSVEA